MAQTKSHQEEIRLVKLRAFESLWQKKYKTANTRNTPP